MMPTVATSKAIAMVAARAAGICCSHVRARHNTAAQLSPIHSKNSEPAARSIQKLS